MTVDILTDPSTTVNMSLEMNVVELLAEACGPRLVEAPLARPEAERLAEAMRVLADPARLQLLSLIAASPSAEACVCNLTAPLGLSQPTVSHHLKLLHDAGLLDREQRGRWAYYRLRSERLRELNRALAAPSPAPA
jgi:ArsR family transcriptional regulator, arsenate/arsenite/antimonite-responsive transcriptional repressor